MNLLMILLPDHVLGFIVVPDGKHPSNERRATGRGLASRSSAPSAHAERKCAVRLRSCAWAAVLAVPPFVVGLVTASPTAADCTSSGGVTLCSQGDVRGSDTGDGPSGAGPYMPYPCEY